MLFAYDAAAEPYPAPKTVPSTVVIESRPMETETESASVFAVEAVPNTFPSILEPSMLTLMLPLEAFVEALLPAPNTAFVPFPTSESMIVIPMDPLRSVVADEPSPAPKTVPITELS